MIRTVLNTKVRNCRFVFWLKILLKLGYSPNNTSMFITKLLKIRGNSVFSHSVDNTNSATFLNG
nr:unnamed protein product [Callosobruchus analis]